MFALIQQVKHIEIRNAYLHKKTRKLVDRLFAMCLWAETVVL